MDPIHQIIIDNQHLAIQNQQLLTWALIVLSILDVASFIGVGIMLYWARGTRESVDHIARLVERQGYYLFGKLGPADLK